MDDDYNRVRELAASERGLLVGPAGYGKTTTLARAVGLTDSRQLVLTHTHAGVRVLKRRLAEVGVSERRTTVSTIAAFCRRWTAAFPNLAQVPEDPNYDDLYAGFARLPEVQQIGRLLSESYNGLFVDEYQDCSVLQHQAIVSLSGLMPTRVVGDPLQSIFRFGGGNGAVDFDEHVRAEFPLLGELARPWRWEPHARELGEQLSEVRRRLLQGYDPLTAIDDLEAIRVPGGVPHAVLRSEAGQLQAAQGTVLVLRQHPNQAHRQANGLPGFVSVEELEGKTVRKVAQTLEAAQGPERAAELLQIAGTCATVLKGAFATQLERLADGERAQGRAPDKLAAITALNRVAESQPDDFEPISEAIAALCAYRDARVFRPDVVDVLRAGAERSGGNVGLTQAVDETLRLRAKRGRLMPQWSVSRTRLVKGIEFDHVIVRDLTHLDVNNAYVALTRGSRSLIVID